MSCSTPDLLRLMHQFHGGSEQRYNHGLNSAVSYTEGVRELARAAEAHWLLDAIALNLAPIYAKAWANNTTGIGLVLLTSVTAKTNQINPTKNSAILKLSLSDQEPPAYVEQIEQTDFPVGSWYFYLGVEEAVVPAYATTIYLPQEF